MYAEKKSSLPPSQCPTALACKAAIVEVKATGESRLERKKGRWSTKMILCLCRLSLFLAISTKHSFFREKHKVFTGTKKKIHKDKFRESFDQLFFFSSFVSLGCFECSQRNRALARAYRLSTTRKAYVPQVPTLCHK